MGDTTGIAWADHTFNPWRGCTRVSPGCLHCYAADLSARNHEVLGTWGPRGPRSPAAEPYWRLPAKWARAAAAAGERRRVFCASLADVFEGDDTMPESSTAMVHESRERLWHTIDQTPELDWLLLTKRPENVAAMYPSAWLKAPPPNVWLGVSAEDQQRADERIPLLLQTPAAVRWVSYEPALELIDFGRAKGLPIFKWAEAVHEVVSLGKGRTINVPRPELAGKWSRYDGIGPWLDWIVFGGESGKDARPFDVAWARSTVKQCRAAGVACFVKQMGRRVHSVPSGFRVDRYILEDGGEWEPPIIGFDRARFERENTKRVVGFKLFDRAGADPTEWPEDLRVREFPRSAIHERRSTW
jgi:protein gp37